MSKLTVQAMDSAAAMDEIVSKLADDDNNQEEE